MAIHTSFTATHTANQALSVEDELLLLAMTAKEERSELVVDTLIHMMLRECKDLLPAEELRNIEQFFSNLDTERRQDLDSLLLDNVTSLLINTEHISNLPLAIHLLLFSVEESYHLEDNSTEGRFPFLDRENAPLPFNGYCSTEKSLEVVGLMFDRAERRSLAGNASRELEGLLTEYYEASIRLGIEPVTAGFIRDWLTLSVHHPQMTTKDISSTISFPNPSCVLSKIAKNVRVLQGALIDVINGEKGSEENSRYKNSIRFYVGEHARVSAYLDEIEAALQDDLTTHKELTRLSVKYINLPSIQVNEETVHFEYPYNQSWFISIGEFFSIQEGQFITFARASEKGLEAALHHQYIPSALLPPAFPFVGKLDFRGITTRFLANCAVVDIGDIDGRYSFDGDEKLGHRAFGYHDLHDHAGGIARSLTAFTKELYEQNGAPIERSELLETWLQDRLRIIEFYLTVCPEPPRCQADEIREAICFSAIHEFEHITFEAFVKYICIPNKSDTCEGLENRLNDSADMAPIFDEKGFVRPDFNEVMTQYKAVSKIAAGLTQA